MTNIPRDEEAERKIKYKERHQTRAENEAIQKRDTLKTWLRNNNETRQEGRRQEMWEARGEGRDETEYALHGGPHQSEFASG